MSKRSELPPAPRRGFTLVELLVAIALGSILIAIVTFVWLQSMRIFSSTVNNLEAYQRLRTVLDLIERDLANTNRTIDMEFFADQDPVNGHRDDTEPLLTHSAAGTGGVGAGTVATSFRRPVDDPTRDLDPLEGQPEFCELDNTDNLNFSETPYFYAPTLFSPPPYAITGEAYLEGREYWRDEAYVRTFITANSTSLPALVHYRLVQQANGRSAIRRRVWWTDPSGAIVAPAVGVSNPTDVVSLLATDICDLKFGFFYKPSTSAGGSSTEGAWYHVGCPVASTDGIKLLQSDQERGFRTATAVGGISTQHENRNQFRKPPTPNGANAVSFLYEGVGRIENIDSGLVLMRTITDITDLAPTEPTNAAARLARYTNFDFPGVRPGDSVYLHDAQDDDDSSIDPDESGPAEARPANDPDENIHRFPNRTFTVDGIIAQLDPSSTVTEPRYFVSVKLREPINFYQLGRRWLIGPDVAGVSGEPECVVDLTNMGATAGPPRTIRQSFNVRYRVAFLPPAFLVRISIDDRYNKRVHQIERVVRILQH